MAGFNGAFYGQNRDGDLFLHQYDPQLKGWPVEARRIGNTFADCLVQADTDGVQVFSASSISFAGGLDRDPAMSALFLNAFREMLKVTRPVRPVSTPMQRTTPAPAVKEPSPTE